MGPSRAPSRPSSDAKQEGRSLRAAAKLPLTSGVDPSRNYEPEGTHRRWEKVREGRHGGLRFFEQILPENWNSGYHDLRMNE